MKLISDEVEFRRMNSTVGKTGKQNYYYTFEDEKGSFQVFSRVDCSKEVKTGEKVHIVYESRLWDNKLQFDMVGVQK